MARNEYAAHEALASSSDARKREAAKLAAFARSAPRNRKPARRCFLARLLGL